MGFKNQRQGEWKRWIYMVIFTSLCVGVMAGHRGNMGECRDSGIWIADGLADCSTLETPSFYGIHRRPDYYCNTYSQTSCCATCTRLGYRTTGTTSTPTPVTTATTAEAMTAVTTVTTPVTNGDICKDVYIWMYDGDVPCDHLEKPTLYGVHKRPEYYCTNYSLTDCCETCTRLGFLPRGSETTPTQVTMETTTPVQTTQQPMISSEPTTDNHICKDVYIWIYDGSVRCDHLEKPTSYGIHKRPEYYCTNYSLTDCCETCTRLGFSATGSEGQQTRVTMATTTVATTTQHPIVIAENNEKAKKCKDAGIWMGNRLLPCRYLEEESVWKIDRRPLYYCHVYPLTDCCRTCSKINSRRFRNVGVDWYKGLWTLLSNS